MIAWSGILGKVLLFVLAKILDTSDRPLPFQRKNAARAFIEMHDALLRLEGASVEFLRQTDPGLFANQPRLYKVPFTEIAKEVDIASNSLVHAFGALRKVVSIYDHLLGVLLSDVVRQKGRFLEESKFLHFAKFDVEPNPVSVFSIKCTTLGDQVMDVDLAAKYRSLEAEYCSADSKMPSELQYFRRNDLLTEWPKDFFSELIEKNISTTSVLANDISGIGTLHERVSKHLPLLAEARKGLSAFIQENFSMGDLLSAGTKHYTSKDRHDSDIFVSYSHQNKTVVDRLVSVLEVQGWSVWWDRALVPGRTFDQVIEAEIESTRCVVVLWSTNSVESDWVRAEAQEGLSRRILVPVLIEKARIPVLFRQTETVDLSDWAASSKNSIDHPEMQRLLQAVRDLVGR